MIATPWSIIALIAVLAINAAADKPAESSGGNRPPAPPPPYGGGYGGYGGMYPPPPTYGGGDGSGDSRTCPAGYGISTQTSVTKGIMMISFTSCPPYSPFGQTTPNKPKCKINEGSIQSTNRFAIYWPPIMSSTLTYVSITFKNTTKNNKLNIKGAIGVSMTGVSVFGDGDADNNDAWLNEGASMDSCRGHADKQGVYHYHTMPGAGCAYNDTAGKHSPVFAVMADGIPLFGSLGDNGIVPTDLDECGGHNDTSYAFYHYHLPNGTVSPYTVRCLRGCLAKSLSPPYGQTPQCTNATVQYDYSKFTLPFVAGFSLDQSPCSNGNVNSTGKTRNEWDDDGSDTSPVLSSVSMNLTLIGVDYNNLVTNSSGMDSVKSNVCQAAFVGTSRRGVNKVKCRTTSVTPGSIVVGMTMTTTDPATAAALYAAVQQFASNPTADFSASFLTDFGVTNFTASTQPPPDYGTSQSSVPVGAIVGAVVGGVAFLALVAVGAVLYAKKRASSAVAPDPEDRHAMLGSQGPPARPGQVAATPPI